MRAEEGIKGIWYRSPEGKGCRKRESVLMASGEPEAVLTAAVV